MPAANWLSLTDYASKYRVSISTLRRRIRGGQIDFRLVDGRYQINDSSGKDLSESGEQEQFTLAVAQEPSLLTAKEVSAVANGSPEEPIISSASKLLSELKRAYTNVLQEKEEQIIQLKEEVSDLKTLVRVLEDENDRLKRALSDRLASSMAGVRL